jgi:Secretion system C-terminal sorting domain
MKKQLYLTLLTALLLFSNWAVKAQCPGAALDSACLTSLIGAGGGICLSALPPGMAHHYYNQDVSYVIPPTIHITTPLVSDVNLMAITVTGMSGAPSFPAGLNWQCDAFSHALCHYSPQAGEVLGAVKFCGTPLIPGHYVITVYIHASVHVVTGGLDVEQDETYVTSLDILPDTAVGSAISFCDSGYYDFNTTLGNPFNPSKYEWDFGNGHHSTLQNPGMQSYPDTGDYVATLKVTTYQYRLKEVHGYTLNSSRWSGDIEEATSNCTGLFATPPDPYFKLTSFGVQSNSITNDCTPDWTGRNDTLPIGTDSLHMEIWDLDGSIAPGISPDDLIVTLSLPPHIGAQLWNVDGSSGSVVMDTVPGQIVTDTIRIRVNALPNAVAVTATKDSFCHGDSVILTIPRVDGISYQWWKDTVAIPGATDTMYVSFGSGAYSVVLTDAVTGCSSVTPKHSVYEFAIPPVPSVLVTGPGQMAVSNYNPLFVIQWFKDGVPIPGANGIYLSHDGNANYTAMMFNPLHPQCGRMSAVVTISGIGTIMENAYSFDLYPNPNKGSFVLAFNSYIKGDMEVRISNMLGAVVYQEQILGNNSSLEKQINLEHLQAGVYTVTLRSGTNLISKKMIIN